MPRQKIHAVDAPEAIGPYSHAIEQGGIVYFSGQIPLDPKTMSLISEDFARQAQQVFANLTAVCKAADMTLNHLVRLTVYLTDLAHAPLVNTLMTDLFKPPYPARTTIEVSALPKAAQIEIDAIGIR